MNLVFDGPAHPMGLALHSLLALVPLAVWAFLRFVRKNSRGGWMLLAIAGVWFFASNGIQTWDQWRVRELMRTNDGVQVTRGTITESWHIERRERDWSKTSLAYKTIVSEGFDAGGVRFRWNVGDAFSPATFSNTEDPPLTFPKGAPIEVTWFVDGAAQNERRIVRIRMGVGAQAGNAATGAIVAPEGFAGFRSRFVEAFAAGDRAGLTRMTRFPVSFARHAIGKERAEDVWTGLLMPALQTCYSGAAAEPIGDGAVVLACHGTTLVFRSEGGIWALVEVRQGS